MSNNYDGPFDPRLHRDIFYNAIEQAKKYGRQGRRELEEIELLKRRLRMRKAKAAMDRHLAAVQASRRAELRDAKKQAWQLFVAHLATVAGFLRIVSNNYLDREFAQVLRAWQHEIADDESERQRLTQMMLDAGNGKLKDDEDDDEEGGSGGGSAPPPPPDGESIDAEDPEVPADNPAPGR